MAGTPEDLTEHDERRMDAATVPLGAPQRTVAEPAMAIKSIAVFVEFEDGETQKIEIHQPRAATLAHTDEQWIVTDIETGQPKIESPRRSILRLTVTGVSEWFWTGGRS